MTTKSFIRIALVAFILGTVYLFYVAFANAVKVDKVTWCHTEPNGNQQTLELPQVALEQAGHVNASGNPLHAGDHAGACVEPTTVPTEEPTPTEVVTPTPSVDVTPTATPSATPTDVPGTGDGDGLSDGRSDGKSSCPSCTEAPKVEVPVEAPATGRGR